MSWIVVVYLAALAVLLLTSLWVEDELSGRIIHTFTLDNFRQLWDQPANRIITRNTLVMAIVVTITDAVLAFPLAYYMVRMASPQDAGAALRRRPDAALVELPDQGVHVAADHLAGRPAQLGARQGRPGPASTSRSPTRRCGSPSATCGCPTWCCPVYAALERVPSSFLEASADLGGRAWITFRKVIWPLALPGIAAGSIFTFSLTLGDYVAPDLVGGNNHDFIGNVIFRFQGVAQNLPFAAAFACVPVVIVTSTWCS